MRSEKICPWCNESVDLTDRHIIENFTVYFHPDCWYARYQATLEARITGVKDISFVEQTS